MPGKDRSIREKLSWMSITASGTALLLASASYLVYDFVTFRTTMVHALSAQADLVGSNVVSPLLFHDEQAAALTLAALKAEPHITGAAVYDKAGRPFAYYETPALGGAVAGPPSLLPSTDRYFFETGRLVIVRGVRFEGKPVGMVYLQSDLVELRARLLQGLYIGFLVLSVSTTVAIGISWRLQRSISGPISRLAHAAKRVSLDRDYSVRVDPMGHRDEIGLLIETFNEMLSQIQQRDIALEHGRDELEVRVRERTAALQASENELEARIAELNAANRDLESFSYSVSHDLRAPLRHIDGFSRLLEEECGGELQTEAQHYLQRIRQGTRRMGQLVDDLLGLSRIGRQPLRRQMVDLGALAQEVRMELREQADMRGVQRKVDWRIGSLPCVDCDRALMKQVFINLFANAVKYSGTREHAVIEVGEFEQDGRSVIFVRDNGVGFNMKYADKLFGVFQRLHRQEEFEGTGVGLATVHRIIQKHGGRVWVEAEPDRGACFYFTTAAGFGCAIEREEMAAIGKGDS